MKKIISTCIVGAFIFTVEASHNPSQSPTQRISEVEGITESQTPLVRTEKMKFRRPIQAPVESVSIETEKGSNCGSDAFGTRCVSVYPDGETASASKNDA